MMRHGVFLMLGAMALGFLSGCENSEERRARYAQKKPAPRPQERTFEAPKQFLPPPKPKKQEPAWMNYTGEDMRQLTELSGRRVLIVFYASWCEHSQKHLDAVKTYAESQNGKTLAVLIDADKYPDVFRKYEPEAVPTTVLYLEGMKLKTMVGSLSAQRIGQHIEATLRVE